MIEFLSLYCNSKYLDMDSVHLIVVCTEGIQCGNFKVS